MRRIFTSDSLTSLSVAGSAGKSKTYTLRIGRRGKEAWLAVEGLKNVTGQAVGSMTQLDVSPVLYIGTLLQRRGALTFGIMSVLKSSFIIFYFTLNVAIQFSSLTSDVDIIHNL